MTTIDIEEIKRRHGEETRQKRCRSCRGMFPCESLQMAREIELMREGSKEDLRIREDEQRRRAEAVRARDEALGRLATAYEDAGTFRRQRDELVRLIDRKLMPAYVQLCHEAGLGDVSQSEAVKAIDTTMKPYREILERRTEPEGATP